ncbi:hypothetical protein L226DRAFT_567614 [Lentinus tigrinus ALCF2SS1-7]|uniref:Uncharacterized protein n=1 Tax=Lentinus tigrinus ALCF2SS1-6 TaxID=1328759 RepID=A0A5C2RZV5_9APHY|nr:hypothetical protein L227DRAFT_614456 [Lentinus tigrinus ALCF2SS1-6]RPD79517.1 hypothetical protein L226DRAFT_567614 [Lentinus tigrinus ALCF2SS1-7]
MLTLLRCRLLNHAYQDLADREIQLDMRSIVSHYVPDAVEFLAALQAHGAVVSGRAALSLFLRDNSLLDKDLEVCVSWGGEEPLHKYVLSSLPVVEVLGPDKIDGICQDSDEGLPSRYTKTFKVLGRRTRYIRVVGCSYASPLGAVNATRHTALMCFFTPSLMGCAYPYLTLRRLALLRPSGAMQWGWHPDSFYEKMQKSDLFNRGFRFSYTASDFVTPPVPPIDVAWDGRPRRPCLRSLFVCGCNVRYWGDRACLMAVLDRSQAWKTLLMTLDEGRGAIFHPWELSGPHVGGWDDGCDRVRNERDDLHVEMGTWDCLMGEAQMFQRPIVFHVAPSFPGDDRVYAPPHDAQHRDAEGDPARAVKKDR